MFTTKQSDIFYNDQTKEMFVCKVSSISAKRCEGSEDIVHGALPIVYKIDKDTNYQSIIYPKNLTTFITDNKSDLYNLLPSQCYADDTDFSHITKPLINYNKSSDRYSVTCIGKYSAASDGFGIMSYIFQYIDTNFHLLDSKILIPKAKAIKTPPFTFKNGYLNSDLIIGGNPLRWGDSNTFFTVNSERFTDYLIKPTHIMHNNSLGFNLIQSCISEGVPCLAGGPLYPFLWSGGYITYNPKYTAFDPNYDIRVDFRARSFNVPSMTAYRSRQSDNAAAQPSRWIEKVTSTSSPKLSGAGSGFCVYFYENPDEGGGATGTFVEPNGIGSTLGYAIAGNVGSEINGELTSVEGLVINLAGNIGSGSGPNADSFLGVGFDIRGDFCTTSESKEGWLSASDIFKAPTPSTWTTAPCSVGIRGNRNHYTRVLTCISLSDTDGALVPMHEDASTSDGSDVDFQDYRVDLTDKGTRVTVYNKLTGATDYNTVLQLDLNKTYGNVGYDAWGNIGEPLITNPTLAPLNVGLTFTTSDFCSFFELSSFEVTGVQIGKPNETPTLPDNKITIDYLEESSANLRRQLVSIPKDNLVDITMLISRQSLLDRIELCSMPSEIVDTEVEVKWTAHDPHKLAIDLPGPPPIVPPPPPPNDCVCGWYERSAGTYIGGHDLASQFGGHVVAGDNSQVSTQEAAANKRRDDLWAYAYEQAIDSGSNAYMAKQAANNAIRKKYPNTGGIFISTGSHQYGAKVNVKYVDDDEYSGYIANNGLRVHITSVGSSLQAVEWTTAADISIWEGKGDDDGLGWQDAYVGKDIYDDSGIPILLKPGDGEWTASNGKFRVVAIYNDCNGKCPFKYKQHPDPDPIDLVGPNVLGHLVFNKNDVGDPSWSDPGGASGGNLYGTQTSSVWMENPTNSPMAIMIFAAGDPSYPGEWAVPGFGVSTGDMTFTIPAKGEVEVSLTFSEDYNSIDAFDGLTGGNWFIGDQTGGFHIGCIIEGTRAGGGTIGGGTGSECPPVGGMTMGYVDDINGTSQEVYVWADGRVYTEGGATLRKDCSWGPFSHQFWREDGGTTNKPFGSDGDSNSDGGYNFGPDYRWDSDADDINHPCQDTSTPPPIGTKCPMSTYWGQNGYG